VAKIMLVEDDNNLREIYEARLLAEGYEIVSAHDGEEALALAVKEKPDLIIADVMMPKISGFDMLDILRSTPESKDTKVIMMTALSQAEDKARADKLGADRYLVKSQVTLEDVAKIAKEVLESAGAVPSAPSSAVPVADPTASMPSEPAATPDPAPSTPPADTPAPASPVVVPDAPVATPDPTPAAPVSSGPSSMTFDPSAVPGAPADTSSVSPAPDPAPEPASTQIPVVEAPVATPPESTAPNTAVAGEKVIQPLAPEAPVAEPTEPAAMPQPTPTVITPTEPPSQDKSGPDPNLVAL